VVHCITISNTTHTINNIKAKLTINNAIALKADKGNTIVIMYADDYHSKIQDFISNNNFTTVNKDLTKRFQKRFGDTIKDCPEIIHKYKKWKHINLNPTTLTIRGLPKIHKEQFPIRPIVNWQNAPACKLAKLLSNLIQSYIPLLNTFNARARK
jgi:hypothetical protein